MKQSAKFAVLALIASASATEVHQNTLERFTDQRNKIKVLTNNGGGSVPKALPSGALG